MMKTHRTTYSLLGLFVFSLLAMWVLDYFGVATDKERRLRESRVLPDLLEMPEASIRKLEIERGGERLVFERREKGRAGWQMVEPIGAAAESSRLETLIHNLKELRLSLDSGVITGPEATYGLAQPSAIVRVWGEKDGKSELTGRPLAYLALGKTVRGLRYVRPDEKGPTLVADAKLLTLVDQPVHELRERIVMGVPTFLVKTLTITRGGQSIRAERGRRGQWRLTAPVVTPADNTKVESLLAAIASLRVTDAAKGFAADNVSDYTPFGLDTPQLTVTLTTTRNDDLPLVLHVGKSVPGREDRVYARQDDQNDVVTVDSKPVTEIPRSSLALRGQRIADIDPAAVTEIDIKSKDLNFTIKKELDGWMITDPTNEPADMVLVQSLLRHLDSLQTPEFLEPGKIRDPGLSPPAMTIRIRQSPAALAGSSADDDLALDLKIGRYEALGKVLYAQLANDPYILMVPDTLLEVLPKTRLAFRNHAVVSASPASITKLTITRAGRTDEFEPDKSGSPNAWRMRRPAEGSADTRSVTQALAVLTNLRASEFVADSRGQDKLFGLDKPILEIAWESDRSHRLKIGAQVPRKPAYYAAVDQDPYVFVLGAETLKPFEAEFRDHVVLKFPLAQAERIVLSWGWPRRDVGIRHRSQTAKGQPEWVDEPDSDARGIDLSGIAPLVKAMSRLETIHYVQYDGAIPSYTGLTRPRLTVQVKLGSDEPDRVIRIGYVTSSAFVFAAEGTAGAGPVFLLPAISWDALIQSGERLPSLPANVFTSAVR
jgi:hypothetical protein